MSEAQTAIETKTFPMCFGAIDQRATKCPDCHSFQGFYLLAERLAKIGLAFGFIAVVVGALMVEYELGRKLLRDNANYADQISIQSTDMFLSPPDSYPFDDEGKVVSVVGRITNESSALIGFIEVTVEVRNDKSELIESFDEYISGPLSPGQSTSFRVNSDNRIHLPESDYEGHTVIVRQAVAKD